MDAQERHEKDMAIERQITELYDLKHEISIRECSLDKYSYFQKCLDMNCCDEKIKELQLQQANLYSGE